MKDENMADDAEFESALMAAFGSMKAPDDVVARTLKAMEEAAGAQELAEAAHAETASVNQTSAEPVRRSRFRKVMGVAVAACLAFACIGGGIAYAIPTAYVSVQGATSIRMAVNCFGIVISATADDDAGKALLNSVAVQNKPYNAAVADLLGKAQDLGFLESGNVDFAVDTGNADQAAQLKGDSQQALDDHRASDNVEANGEPRDFPGGAEGTSQGTGAQTQPEGGQYGGDGGGGDSGAAGQIPAGPMVPETGRANQGGATQDSQKDDNSTGSSSGAEGGSGQPIQTQSADVQNGTQTVPQGTGQGQQLSRQ